MLKQKTSRTTTKEQKIPWYDATKYNYGLRFLPLHSKSVKWDSTFFLWCKEWPMKFEILVHLDFWTQGQHHFTRLFCSAKFLGISRRVQLWSHLLCLKNISPYYYLPLQIRPIFDPRCWYMFLAGYPTMSTFPLQNEIFSSNWSKKITVQSTMKIHEICWLQPWKSRKNPLQESHVITTQVTTSSRDRHWNGEKMFSELSRPMVVVHHLVDVLEWHLPSKVDGGFGFFGRRKKNLQLQKQVIYEGAFTSKFLAKCEVK